MSKTINNWCEFGWTNNFLTPKMGTYKNCTPLERSGVEVGTKKNYLMKGELLSDGIINDPKSPCRGKSGYVRNTFITSLDHPVRKNGPIKKKLY